MVYLSFDKVHQILQILVSNSMMHRAVREGGREGGKENLKERLSKKQALVCDCNQSGHQTSHPFLNDFFYRLG